MFEELFEKGGLSLDRLHTLCVVADKGSIGEASQGDPNRQTQFSRQMSELEKFFGVDLLNRDSRPHRMTEAGSLLAGLSRDYLRALSDFQARCGDRPVKLAIGAGESIIQWLLLPMLEKWGKKLPGVSIAMRNLRTQQIIRDVNDGELDLGLVRRSAISKPLRSAGKWEFQYRLFVPKRLRAKLVGKPGIAELSALPLALIEGEGEFRQQLASLANSHGVGLDVRLECSSYSQVATAIGSGAYCGFLPQFAGTYLRASVESFEVAGLEALKRELAFVWNPRKAALRPVIEKALKVFK